MIKTKYVVGDVVVVKDEKDPFHRGKQLVVRGVEAFQSSLYEAPGVIYSLSDDKWYLEEELV